MIFYYICKKFIKNIKNVDMKYKYIIDRNPNTLYRQISIFFNNNL